MPTAKKLPSSPGVAGSISVNPKKVSPSTAPLQPPAKKQAEMDAILCSRESRQPESELTLGAAIDRYIDIKSAILSPATIHGYKSLRRSAFPAIIDRALSALSKEIQQVAINEYAAAHSQVSAQRSRFIIRSITSAL